MPDATYTLDKLVVNYESPGLLRFPPRVNDSITHDMRAMAFTRWYNDPARYGFTIPGIDNQQALVMFPGDVTLAVANPRSGLQPLLDTFTRKMLGEVGRSLHPRVVSIGWNLTIENVAFGTTNAYYRSPDRRLRQREARNVWRAEDFFLALQKEYSSLVSEVGIEDARHAPGNCAEWNIPPSSLDNRTQLFI
ncbi:hypothetical protein FA95DRAFT_412496 [Auriscalpium vulgare]|uniref:Uncharacterized protein n=1 Tax=Auriscalpium vulgare TaxID=40419 RepID=A0ACB8RIC2_9AGAM|nr:hypothetical protein FA95DRAFT_412496 [Auriscalpium vulgare]